MTRMRGGWLLMSMGGLLSFLAVTLGPTWIWSHPNLWALWGWRVGWVMLGSVGLAHLADRLVRPWQRAASIDGLTGLLRPEFFWAAVADRQRLASRSGVPLTFVYLDVDHFKAVNDHAGHAAGDAVLRQLGHALAASARDTDVVGRLGGDEFAWVLWDADHAQAEHAVARVLQDACNASGEHPAFGVSAGLSMLPPTVALSVADWARLADRDLYAAKARRRTPHDGTEPLTMVP